MTPKTAAPFHAMFTIICQLVELLIEIVGENRIINNKGAFYYRDLRYRSVQEDSVLVI